ncbi:MFS transporter [Streptomyces sp. NPDC005925]|uniref:MFS transporter n=1 Tax=Streptomyces sp. NPDC005925 TaxID=3157172 RepID=UPI0033D4533A
MADTVSTTGNADRTGLRRVLLSSFAGTSIEWYDFFLFGSAAALVFPHVFFPESDPATGTLLSFATYAVAFLARPLGGVVFGRMGDTVGRKQALIATLFLAGAGTFLMGCLPSYDTIGVSAPVLLVVLRLVQGLGLGGEWAGAVTLSAEHAEAGGRQARRGVLTSWTQLGVPAGNLIAVGALTAASSLLSDEAFLSWGWRLPFLASAVLVGAGWWMRIRVEESPLFEATRPIRAPLREVLTHHWREVLLTVGMRIASDVSYYVFAVFALSYLSGTMGLPRNWGLWGVIAGSVLQLALIPAAAAASDTYGRRPVYIAGAVAVAVAAVVAWPMIATGTLTGVIGAITIGLAAQAVMYGPMAAFITELYSTRLRCSGSSFGYQVAGIVGGAPAPLVATLLVDRFHTTTAVSVYVVLTAVLAAASAYLARETRWTRLSGPHSCPVPAPVEGSK